MCSKMGILWYNRQMTAGIIARIILFFAFLMKAFAKNNSLTANFIFGDTLLEVGNNNYILTLAKANYIPNGIDFGKPTGRFTNGRTVIDIIGQELGMKNFTPPYLAQTTVGPVILKGVNYASGVGGILNETGQLYGGRINMNGQLDNFANTRQDIIKMIGAAAAEELLHSSLFLVWLGSEDYINNYLTPGKKPPPEVFNGNMISRYRQQLTRLYNMDAKKIVVVNVPPIGCIPFLRDTNLSMPGDSCVAFPNQIAQSFNSQLKSLVTALTANLTGSKFLYADAYRIISDTIENPKSYGFENVNSACCSLLGENACCSLLGENGGLIPCNPLSKVCPNRSKYVFWDPFHPTDAVNEIVAKRLLHGATDDISPMNIMQLLQS